MSNSSVVTFRTPARALGWCEEFWAKMKKTMKAGYQPNTMPLGYNIAKLFALYVSCVGQLVKHASHLLYFGLAYNDAAVPTKLQALDFDCRMRLPL